MKLITKFSEFLDNTVNLNQTRIDKLTSRTETIETFIRRSDYCANIQRFSTQGSWAHKTIIKPVSSQKEFDADMVVYVDELEGWEARDYIEELYREFRKSSTYSQLVGRKSRCVTLDYAGDFHLDVVPITVREHFFSSNSYRVCNRHTNDFELSDGDGFKNWWSENDRLVSNHRLIKVARLVKYIRDTKTTFSCKSILLTTLIGNTIDEDEVGLFESALGEGFEDVPTTLKTVFGRLDNFLQGELAMPDVRNPVLEEESFTRNWTEDQYQNFRDVVHTYRSWIDDAYDEPDRDESVRKWRKLFGDGFAPDVIVKSTQTVTTAPVDESLRREADALISEMKADLANRVVDTDKLLRLIHFGADNLIPWPDVISMAQSNYELVEGDEEKDVAKVNFYQITKHRGIEFSPEALADIQGLVNKRGHQSGFALCGNLLLGKATKDMADAAEFDYGSLEAWPIMRLATWKMAE